MSVYIYSDGSYQTIDNEKVIGLGAVLVLEHQDNCYITLEVSQYIDKDNESYKLSSLTSELLAAELGLLQIVNKNVDVKVLSDNNTLCETMRGRSRASIIYDNIWQQLNILAKSFKQCNWEWIKSHGVDFFNNKADALAQEAIELKLSTVKKSYAIYTKDYAESNRLEFDTVEANRDLLTAAYTVAIAESELSNLINYKSFYKPV